MYKNRSRGFTLIELLVVIAIIGILSAVVLASLNTARSKSQDAAVQTDLSSIQTQAELFYGNNSNSYGTLAWTTGVACYPSTAGTYMFTSGAGGDATIAKAVAAADTANGTRSVGCASDGTSYVVAAELSATPAAAYWCVDSTGNSKQVNASFPATAIASCP